MLTTPNGSLTHESRGRGTMHAASTYGTSRRSATCYHATHPGPGDQCQSPLMDPRSPSPSLPVRRSHANAMICLPVHRRTRPHAHHDTTRGNAPAVVPPTAPMIPRIK
jgi:hypothetical protein